jgi:hypothetical protein
MKTVISEQVRVASFCYVSGVKCGETSIFKQLASGGEIETHVYHTRKPFILTDYAKLINCNELPQECVSKQPAFFEGF